MGFGFLCTESSVAPLSGNQTPNHTSSTHTGMLQTHLVLLSWASQHVRSQLSRPLSPTEVQQAQHLLWQQEWENHLPARTLKSKYTKSTDDLTREFPDRFTEIGKLPGKYRIQLCPDTHLVIHTPRKLPNGIMSQGQGAPGKNGGPWSNHPCRPAQRLGIINYLHTKGKQWALLMSRSAWPQQSNLLWSPRDAYCRRSCKWICKFMLLHQAQHMSWILVNSPWWRIKPLNYLQQPLWEVPFPASSWTPRVPWHGDIPQPLCLWACPPWLLFCENSWKKDADFTWNASYKAVFQQVKQAVVSNTTLTYFNPSLPVTIQVNASQVGVGAALLQDNKPIAFATKAITHAECWYANIERDASSCLWSREILQLCLWMVLHNQIRP